MTAAEELKKKDIVDSLYWDVRVDASDVSVQVENGTAFLSGTVPSFAARRAAADDAWRVDGIHAVDSQLTVDYKVPLPTDEEIQTGIKSVLLWSSAIDSSKIEIEVRGGKVTLRGTVASYWQRLRAQTLAEDVTGVIALINELTVVPTESILDEDIARQIIKAFEQNPLIDEDTVTVAVERGKVTLTGNVLTWSARNQARGTVASVPGVIFIDNRIMVMDTSG
jgi:osmotically-inducible protein OsmY